jgi:uncharacterized protein (DUF1501 family)
VTVRQRARRHRRAEEGRRVAAGSLQGRITHEEFLDRVGQLAAQERADALYPAFTTTTACASVRRQEGRL